MSNAALKKPSGNVIQIFLNTDFRCAHDGLAAIAKKEGINVETLHAGNYVVFVNARRNRVKLYACGDVVAYKRLRIGETLDLRVLKYIPSVFKGNTLDIDAATYKFITENTEL